MHVYIIAVTNTHDVRMFCLLMHGFARVSVLLILNEDSGFWPTETKRKRKYNWNSNSISVWKLSVYKISRMQFITPFINFPKPQFSKEREKKTLSSSISVQEILPQFDMEPHHIHSSTEEEAYVDGSENSVLNMIGIDLGMHECCILISHNTAQPFQKRIQVEALFHFFLGRGQILLEGRSFSINILLIYHMH
ncbi:hypothetical protein ACJX0J_040298, partial [Zea mays]